MSEETIPDKEQAVPDNKEELDAAIAERDGPLPAQLRDPGGAGLAEDSITADGVYSALDGMKEGDDQDAVDKEIDFTEPGAEPEQAERAQAEAEEAAAPEPPKKEEPKAEEVEVVEEPKKEEPVQPEEPQKRRIWDRDRQKSDEAAASLRRTVTELQQEVTALKAGATGEESKEATDLMKLAQLDVDAADHDDLLRHVNALTTGIQQEAQRRGEEDKAVREVENDDALDKLLEEGVEIVGEEKRNDLVEAVEAEFAKRGYKPESLPSYEAVQDLVHRKALELKGPGESTPKAEPKAPKKPAPPTDTAKGGGAAKPSSKVSLTADIDEAMDEMIADGEFPGLKG